MNLIVNAEGRFDNRLVECRDGKGTFDPIDPEKPKKYDTHKRPLFTPFGLLISWWIVSSIDPNNIGILHASFKKHNSEYIIDLASSI
jgi:hypothetical protein